MMSERSILKKNQNLTLNPPGYKVKLYQTPDKVVHCDLFQQRREDLESLKFLIIQIFFKNSSVFIGSIHQTTDKKEFRALLELMSSYPLILGGNHNLQLRSMIVYGFKWIAVRKDTQKKGPQFIAKYYKKKIKQIDYIFYNQVFRIKQKTQELPKNDKKQPLSDHNPILMKLYMEKDIRIEFPFFDQEQAKIILQGKKEDYNNINEMIKIANEQLPSTKIVKFKIPSFQKLDEQYKLNLTKLINKNRKEFHQIENKKAGMIANILSIESNKFITDYKQINSECINQLCLISLILNKNSQREWIYQNQIDLNDIGQDGFEGIEIPDLSVTTQEEKNQWCKENEQFKYKWPLRGDKYEYYNKAISYDLTHLQIIRELWEQNNRQDFSFMNIQELNKYRFIMKMRLIPISKISPNIPNKEQIRPIVVMSHVIKMIELFYEERLKEYVNYYINPEQIGFLQGSNKILIKKTSKGKTAIFIDLSNAYNVVDRQILYNIMKKRQVFGEKALNFLFYLYDELNIWDDIKKQKFYMMNGLHQGSILLPYLFDIQRQMEK